MARPVARTIAVNPEALAAVAQFVSGSTTLLHGKVDVRRPHKQACVWR